MRHNMNENIITYKGQIRRQGCFVLASLKQKHILPYNSQCVVPALYLKY